MIRVGYLLGGLFLLGLGIVNVIYPSFAWYIREGWKVDGDSEPSDMYLALSKAGGVAIILFGSIFLLIGFAYLL
ncbi:MULTISPECIES: DUF6199 family natural product biosynthesis protein [Paenibacillus]|uniref:DUF6199 family natural product biosynthesis protein n=1 Tax=Paenibacillus TaxID=44249 RepID=UPI00061EE0C3|nr:hypothetical protein VE23_06955 [Paenibacillus sp. D9]